MAISTRFPELLFWLVLVIFVAFHLLHMVCAFRISSEVENAELKCIAKEREALLKLKREFIDDFGSLSSWGPEEDQKDCCKWKGVRCDNQTGHVLLLDLRPLRADQPLRGNISSSLLELRDLRYLDLSSHNFFGSHFPDFIGSSSSLQYLKLASCSFSGTIPAQLGNLSQLQLLDLSYNFLNSQSLDWLSSLRSLRFLKLSSVDLSQATDWIEAVLKLHSLEELHMDWCKLPSVLPPPSLSLINSSRSLTALNFSGNRISSFSVYPWLSNISVNLRYLDLSVNNLQGPIRDAFGNMFSLEHLDVHYSGLEGGIPVSFGNLSSLIFLDLSSNNLAGEYPALMKILCGPGGNTLMKYLDLSQNWFFGSFPDLSSFPSLMELRVGDNKLNGSFLETHGELPNLVILDLSRNQLTGPLPDLASCFPSLRELNLDHNQFCGEITVNIGSLNKLEILRLGSNLFQGIISEVHLFNLSELHELDMSGNSPLVLNFSPDWIPPFQLSILALSSLRLGPQFPKWLHMQENISSLDISSSQISEEIPDWFWHLISPQLTYLNLANNQIHGTLPDLSVSLSGYPRRINLSTNNFHGSIPLLPSNIMLLDLSKNNFSGSISTLCNVSDLQHLDLSDNSLSGQLPDCLADLTSLCILNLADNNFSGMIPDSFGSMLSLGALHLRNNNLRGEIPDSLQNCEYLAIIDFAGNRLSGEIPTWIGYNLPHLVVLSLRSNEFHNGAPSSLCLLARIQILDLSRNNMSGTIPKCLHNLTAVAQEGSSMNTIQIYIWINVFEGRPALLPYDELAVLIWKGIESRYRSRLGLVKSIDLSSNLLSGEIPPGITSLLGLIGLNMSRNYLTGGIPSEIGQLRSLNFLDLSNNQLSGGIPVSLSQLTHLGVIDLSNNNLSGRIPFSTQLQTFNASAYAGNAELCGLPLTKTCPGDETGPETKANDHQEKGSEFVSFEFYISMLLGFAVGFWGVCGTLVLNRSLRHSFFKILNNVEDWLYIKIALSKARLRRYCMS